MIRALLLLVLLVPLAPLAQGRARVVAVKSQALAPYASVVAGFGAELRGTLEEVTLEESAEAAARTFKRIAAQKPSLVLALGPLAANVARRELGEDIPVLFCMVPYYEKYALEGPNVTGIALTSDFSVEMEALKAVAPKARRVGILHDPRFSGRLLELAREAAGRVGLAVVALEAESQAEAEKALAKAEGRVDALLMVADKTVASAAVVRQLIEFASARRIPLVALTGSQVKEGAMMAFAPSPTGIGQQAGRLANRIIHERVDPGALAVAQPELLEMSFNLSTARKLGPTSDVALEVLRFAAKRDFPVRVYE